MNLIICEMKNSQYFPHTIARVGYLKEESSYQISRNKAEGKR